MIAALLASVLVAGSAGDPAPATAVTTSGADVVLEFADHLLASGEPYRAAGEYDRYLFLCGACPRATYARRRAIYSVATPNCSRSGSFSAFCATPTMPT